MIYSIAIVARISGTTWADWQVVDDPRSGAAYARAREALCPIEGESIRVFHLTVEAPSREAAGEMAHRIRRIWIGSGF